MAFELPPLPYAQDALEPHCSAKTLSLHHGKHHQDYVSKTNELIAGTDNANKSMEVILTSRSGTLVNQALCVLNNPFLGDGLTPVGGAQPSGWLAGASDKAFGSFDKFKEELKANGVGQVGSGWVWLVKDGSELKIVGTGNADTPLAKGQTAILTCDVWEHAYYLDYQNRRPDFLQAFLDHLANWDFAAKNYGA